jgi:transcriptional regulator with GAF, ATPase, and Fis domain
VADGGTIFLDEIGELPLDTQVKLLRVLQEREFEPVGSSTPKKVDVRVIAATNRDLAAEVAAGRFRADLFYRLNVLPIVVPPLREREGDVALLASFFAARFAREFAKPIEQIAPSAIERLLAYSWPGNVRELSNVVERAVVLSRGPVLDVGPELLPEISPVASGADAEPASGARAGSDAATLRQIEQRHIEDVLARTGGVIEGPQGAAAALGMNPSTLRSRMKKLGIRKPEPRR